MREGSQCLFAENAAPRDPTPNQAEDDGWRLFRRVGGVYKQQTLKEVGGRRAELSTKFWLLIKFNKNNTNTLDRTIVATFNVFCKTINLS